MLRRNARAVDGEGPVSMVTGRVDDRWALRLAAGLNVGIQTDSTDGAPTGPGSLWIETEQLNFGGNIPTGVKPTIILNLTKKRKVFLVFWVKYPNLLQ